MLTEIKVYSSWPLATTLPLSAVGGAETDLIQIRNIDGLDPVKASVNTSPYGSVDGASYTGGNVLSRNIVLTLGLNPDWNQWSYETLRDLLYLYFMPKRSIQLVFYREGKLPVEIYGIVESVGVNPFSKDPEILVSIICPDPYFTALTATVLTGQSVRSGGAVVVVNYPGTIETGIRVKVSFASGLAPTSIGIQIGAPTISYFTVGATVDSLNYLDMSSLSIQKYVQNINLGNGVITNFLSKIVDGSSWPTLQPGNNNFSIITDQGVQDWTLTYFARYGGL